MANLNSKLKNIRLIIFDVDGVLTDNTVFIGPEGSEFKRFNIADGLGIYIAKKFGVGVAFLSGRHSPSTTARARELEISDVVQEPIDKLEFYNQLKAKYNLKDENIAFMGNDLVDIGVMKQCGVAFAVPDSPGSVLEAADYITNKTGGNGAAREVLDLILEAQGIREENRIA
jgi:3-deoxy-D-manno-octulosonate 8-phosphate phosphatase (KDO 8-P phosphatase)